jgi:glycosyltransferase involved in cell wall biosynthesis
MTGPVSIACLLPDLDGGGAQRTMVNLANAFHGDGLDARLIAGRTDGPAKGWMSTAVPLTDLHASRAREMLFPLIYALKANPPDILFSTMIDANIIGFIAGLAPRPGPRIILRETNSQRARGDIGFARRRLIKWTYRRADRVVALSEGVGRELIEDLDLDPSRVQTIHNPVDPSPHHDTGRPAGMPEGRVVVGAGRLIRQKNFPLLIDCLPDLPSDVSLVLLGEGPDRPALTARVEELGLSDRVRMPGFVEDPSAWFAHADVFALSSRWEGFGHVIVEAMASGAPVVVTDCPHGPRDIIADGRTGLLVPNEDAGALAAALTRVLNDTALAEVLRAAGRARARDFSVARIVERYKEMFSELMGRSV